MKFLDHTKVDSFVQGFEDRHPLEIDCVVRLLSARFDPHYKWPDKADVSREEFLCKLEKSVRCTRSIVCKGVEVKRMSFPNELCPHPEESCRIESNSHLSNLQFVPL